MGVEMTDYTDELQRAVESLHSRQAKLVRSVPVREKLRRKAWEGTVHIFDIQGNPSAKRAYAWSSPMEGEIGAGSPRLYTSASSDRPSTRYALRCRGVSFEGVRWLTASPRRRQAV